jgi:hypothetical protein
MTISACDFLGTILLLAGFPSTNDNFCSAQAFMNLFFYRGSWFFTVAFQFQLFGLIIYNKNVLKERFVHMICWGINIIIAFIPFATPSVNYGVNPSYAGFGYCTLTANDLNLIIDYQIVESTAPIIVSVLLLIVLSAAAFITCSYSSNLSDSAQVWSLAIAMATYPATMIVSWLPAVLVGIITGIIFNQTTNESTLETLNYAQVISIAIGSLYGGFLGIIFLYNSRESRQRW